MPKVKFNVSVPGDAANRNGWNAGDTVWIGADEAERRAAANEITVLEPDPGPGTVATPDTPTKKSASAHSTPEK